MISLRLPLCCSSLPEDGYQSIFPFEHDAMPLDRTGLTVADGYQTQLDCKPTSVAVKGFRLDLFLGGEELDAGDAEHQPFGS